MLNKKTQLEFFFNKRLWKGYFYCNKKNVPHVTVKKKQMKKDQSVKYYSLFEVRERKWKCKSEGVSASHNAVGDHRGRKEALERKRKYTSGGGSASRNTKSMIASLLCAISFYARERNHVNVNGSTQAEAGRQATAEFQIARSRCATALTMHHLFPCAIVLSIEGATKMQ